jgi:cytochrome bd-type quinol oxidase subunit 2
VEVALSLLRETSEAASRFKTQIERLIALFRRHNVNSIRSLVQAVKRDETFLSEWKRIWREISDADGGKLSLATAGVVLGAALGGVGIAAMGGAIGLPLFFVLGLGGFLAGTEVDVRRRISGLSWTLISLPKEIHARIKEAAETAGCSTNEVIVQALTAAFPDAKALENDDASS